MLYLDKIIGQSSLPKVYIGIGGIVLDNTVFLNTNREMPLLGLGVYKATGKMRPKMLLFLLLNQDTV